MKPGSANQDPIFSSNKLPDGNEPGYPGGIFDPFGWSKGDIKSLKTKEIKNGRLAMLAFAGFAAQVSILITALYSVGVCDWAPGIIDNPPLLYPSCRLTPPAPPL